MIIINQTFNVEDAILNEWLEWIRLVYIPDVMSSGFFVDNKILKILSEDIVPGHTYALQFYLNQVQDVPMVNDNFVNKYEKMVSNVFGEQALSFRTILKEL